MENDHVGDVAESKSRGASALSPFHVFSNLNSSERADGVEVRAEHRQVSGAGKAVLLYVKFEAIGEDAFICLDCSKFLVPIALRRGSSLAETKAAVRSQSGCARQSASMNARIPPLEAALPVLRARPGPGQTSWSKRVPRWRATTPAGATSEPLSTTMTSNRSRSRPCPSRLRRQASRPLG
jgi:hypothetical protein